MKLGYPITDDNDKVMVIHNAEIIYDGLQKDEPMKDKPWEYVLRSRNGRGHYVFEDYRKYCFTPKIEEN